MSEVKQKIIYRIMRKAVGEHYNMIESKMGLLVELLSNMGYIPIMDFFCSPTTQYVDAISLVLYRMGENPIYITTGGD